MLSVGRLNARLSHNVRIKKYSKQCLHVVVRRSSKEKRSRKESKLCVHHTRHTLIWDSETSCGKLLTMILPSPPLDGPTGVATFSDAFATLVFFCTPPTGAAVALAARWRRPTGRPARVFAFERRSVRMSSRDWLSLFPDIAMGIVVACWLVRVPD